MMKFLRKRSQTAGLSVHKYTASQRGQDTRVRLLLSGLGYLIFKETFQNSYFASLSLYVLIKPQIDAVIDRKDPEGGKDNLAFRISSLTLHLLLNILYF